MIFILTNNMNFTMNRIKKRVSKSRNFDENKLAIMQSTNTMDSESELDSSNENLQRQDNSSSTRFFPERSKSSQCILEDKSSTSTSSESITASNSTESLSEYQNPSSKSWKSETNILKSDK